MPTMDLSNLTIPADLFYSKSSNELRKPRSLMKVTPTQIKVKKVSIKRRIVQSRKNHPGPQLGRVGKLKHYVLQKLLLKKQKAASLKQVGNKENKNVNVNKPIVVKPLTIQEERSLMREIREKEEVMVKQMFCENKFTRKRAKGSSFKFFKSKNVRDSEDETFSDESDELVPEIRDFNELSIVTAKPRTLPKTQSVLLDAIAFDDEVDPDLANTTSVIESLLQNLDEGDSNMFAPSTTKTAVEASFTLKGLIDTLEGKPEKSKQEVRKSKFMGLGRNQLQIDAGQKKFGLVTCRDCGFSYNTNVPEDEKIHNKHHQAVTTIPRFRGWANEDSMKIKEWSEQYGRIVHLQPNSKNTNSDYVKEIIAKMELEFGVQDNNEKVHFYLAIYDMKVVGLSTVKEFVEAQKGSEKKTVRLGVQRLFVRQEFRRKGIATALLKTLLLMHNKGELYDLENDVAFSTPTEQGRKLIENITGSKSFFVYTS